MSTFLPCITATPSKLYMDQKHGAKRQGVSLPSRLVLIRWLKLLEAPSSAVRCPTCGGLIPPSKRTWSIIVSSYCRWFRNPKRQPPPLGMVPKNPGKSWEKLPLPIPSTGWVFSPGFLVAHQPVNSRGFRGWILTHLQRPQLRYVGLYNHEWVNDQTWGAKKAGVPNGCKWLFFTPKLLQITWISIGVLYGSIMNHFCLPIHAGANNMLPDADLIWYLNKWTQWLHSQTFVKTSHRAQKVDLQSKNSSVSTLQICAVTKWNQWLLPGWSAVQLLVFLLSCNLFFPCPGGQMSQEGCS